MTIMNEIRYVMEAYGINIDIRHLMLAADVMTFKVRDSRKGVGRRSWAGYIIHLWSAV